MKKSALSPLLLSLLCFFFERESCYQAIEMSLALMLDDFFSNEGESE
jgi:hypothetical protein